MKRRRLAIPTVHLGCAMLAIVLLLPSILRPPPDQATQSAQLSPDAPPEEEAETIIQSLRQAGSRTAGGRVVEAAAQTPGAPPPPTTTTTAKPVKPARGRCYGDPPRQTESLYSTYCAPAWTGEDNGGATDFGVFPNEVRVALATGDSWQGPVDTPWQGNEQEPAKRRSIKAIQDYFNANYEFYGRTLRFFIVNVSGGNVAQGREAAQKAKREFEAFATNDQVVTNPGWMDGSVAEEMVTFVRYHVDEWFKKNEPYGYSFSASAEQLYKMTADMTCKQLAGKPPTLTEPVISPNIDSSQPRVFGLINYIDSSRVAGKDLMRNEMKRRCGADIKTEVTFNLADGGHDDAAAAITKMRADGVTTIIMANDWFSTIVLTHEADSQGYYPEWVMTGSGGHGSNGSGQLANQRQWAHAIGLGTRGIEGFNEEADYYRAFKQMRPDEEPSGLDPESFYEWMMIANGIQGAGPKLTVESFQKGLRSMPKRPPNPRWTLGGGFDIGDWSYVDYFSMVWWDPQTTHPGGSGLPGVWRHVHGGCMYTYEKLPSDPAPFQKSGVATPKEASEAAARGETCPTETNNTG